MSQSQKQKSTRNVHRTTKSMIAIHLGTATLGLKSCIE